MKNDFRARNHPAYWAFIVHRGSGVLLALFLPLHFWALGQALHGAAALDGFLRWTEQPLVKFAETGLVLLLAAHMAGGLRLLAHADPQTNYAFSTRQGRFALRGASLRGLPVDGPRLDATVLYFCDGPAESIPRLLSAASRMQLLSAPPSLEYASRAAQDQNAAQALAPVWQLLLESPQWASVLHQYPTLCQARELMVHADDLTDAINAIAA